MKIFLEITGIIISIIIVGFVIKIVFFPVNVAQKELQTAYDTVNKTINADNAIYNYEWFKQTKQDIDAIGRKYNNACVSLDDFVKTAGEHSTWTFEDKSEYNRLNAVKLGIKNQLEQVIANYNARASMANRAIFADSILPSYINALTFIKK